MSTQIDIELVIAYLLGELSPELRAEVEAAIALNPELKALAEAFEGIGASVQAVSSPTLKNRVLASAAADRFAPFVGRFARMIDTTAARAREILALIDGVWEKFPWSGCEVLHLQGGPATVGADVGFVRVEPGVRFPYHIHKGKETALILQGGVREDDDTIYQTGDLYVATVDAHSFTALPGEPLIYAVVVWGVEFPEA